MTLHCDTVLELHTVVVAPPLAHVLGAVLQEAGQGLDVAHRRQEVLVRFLHLPVAAETQEEGAVLTLIYRLVGHGSGLDVVVHSADVAA